MGVCAVACGPGGALKGQDRCVPVNGAGHLCYRAVGLETSTRETLTRWKAAMFWCLGMFSSASTWTSNVVHRIAESLAPVRPPVPVFLNFSDPLPDGDEMGGTLIVKTHGTAVARELGARAAGIVVTIRDPRDAIVSLMRHNKVPFEIALRMTEVSARTCAPFMRHERAVVFRFEDRFFDDPRTVDRIAALFPGVLPAGEGRRIFDAFRRDAVEAFIAGLEALPTTLSHVRGATGQQDTYDTVTGWHRHHAGRTGEVGRWRRDLSGGQLRIIERRLRIWMERVGYDSVTSRGAGYALSIARYGVVD
jgi:hypothetical protein